MSNCKIPLKRPDETLLEYSARLAEQHSYNCNIASRKEKGQIFTPKEVAAYMADFFEFPFCKFSLLDPGAGTGILLSAVCQRIIEKDDAPTHVRIDAYENDLGVLPYLHATMKACSDSFLERGITFEYNVFGEDFILANYSYACPKGALSKNKETHLYDAVISNPPYYKLNKGSQHAHLMEPFISGQPNIYSLFMVLSSHMVREGGDIVVITPRSFCSGLYYRNIREWFVNNTCIKWLHNFESRKKVFDSDAILQENVILHAIKTTEDNCQPANTSICYDKTFSDYQSFTVAYKNLIMKRGKNIFIRIPTSESEIKIIKIIDEWEYTLEDLGLKISTGPVVDFRTKENLRSDLHDGVSVPLLWMHNLVDGQVYWPVQKNGKFQGIALNENTLSLVVPVENYILIKRFSSKEQNRRLYATPFLKEQFAQYHYIGFENHLNYIHKPGESISRDEVFGLSALFNTAFIDHYFRALNGNTQVNATEIRTMPLPSAEQIRKIGQTVQKKNVSIGYDLDKCVAEELQIDETLINELYGLESQ